MGELKTQELPPVPPLLAALGPGIVWMALAQGSGELYFWPYFAAKYGPLYLCLLLPACVLQTPLNLEIGRYTLLTGESVFRGFVRLHPAFGLLLWAGFTVNFLLVAGFASAGGTALADLLPWPSGWSAAARTLLWTYALTSAFAAALFLGRQVYRLLERFMLAVALVTTLGLVAASLQPRVLAAAPDFLRALLLPSRLPPLPTAPGDLERFYTMVCYTGLGGFWALFYSLWLREKGTGMAAHRDPDGLRFDDSPENRSRWRGWMRILAADNAVGILGNLLTTALITLLAFALLHPEGKVPDKWRLVAEQGDFFGAAWGPAGRVVFLLVAGCFLIDSWLGGVDAVSRVHSELLCTYSDRARARGPAFWYRAVLAAMCAVTWITLPLGEPGPLLAAGGMISVFAVAVFSVALGLLNYRVLPRTHPAWTRGRPLQLALFGAVSLFYIAAAVYYVVIKLRASS